MDIEEAKTVISELSGATISVPVKLPTNEEFLEATQWVLFELCGDHEIGVQPGGFMTDLIHLIAKADEQNKKKLAMGFPAVGSVVATYLDGTTNETEMRHFVVHNTKTPDAQPGNGFSPKGN